MEAPVGSREKAQAVARQERNPEGLGGATTFAPISIPPVEPLIAGCRVALVAIVALSLVFERTQAAAIWGPRELILLGYTGCALLILGGSRQIAPSSPVLLVSHGVDVGTFLLLFGYADGATEPLLALFTFAILAAALRWGATGALWTTGALLVGLAVLPFAGDQLRANTVGVDPGRAGIIIAFVACVGTMMTWLAAREEAARAFFAALMAWPEEHEQEGVAGDLPLLTPTLAHAAAITGAQAVALVWGVRNVGTTHFATWRHGRYDALKLSPGWFGRPVAAQLDGHAFVATASTVLACSGTNTHFKQPPISARVLEAFSLSVGVVAAAPVLASAGEGWVFLVNPQGRPRDLVDVARAVGTRLASSFDAHDSRREFGEAVAADERRRLARDIHDGALQGLAAVGLRLAALAERETGGTREQVNAIAELLGNQQRRIRELIKHPEPEKTTWRVQEGCERVMTALAKEWRIETSVEVTPTSLQLENRLGEQVSLLLNEAVANAVRHGSAGRIGLRVRATDGNLGLVIENDGRPTLSGSTSLRERVAMLGGRLKLHDTAEHVRVEVEVPL